ncbi:MAG: hypothetical protein AAFR54_17145 [Planctomycetota bacterium]
MRAPLLTLPPPTSRRLAQSLLLAGSAVLLPACSSTSPPRMKIDGGPTSAVGQRAGAYALCASSADLEALIAEDLEAGRADLVFDGLQAFVGENDRRRTMTGAHLVWQRVRPVAMLQYGGGRSQMTAVRQLGQVLATDAAAEKSAALDSLRAGHLGAVAEYATTPLGPLHPATAALSDELVPYSRLAGALLAYRDLAAADAPDEAALNATLEELSGAEVALAQAGDARAAFLAMIAGAQSLERAGDLDAAAEFWLRAAGHPAFESQPAMVRDLVAARIDSYSARVRESLLLEVEEERRAELRAQAASYARSVEELESRFASFDEWAAAGFEAIDARVRVAREESGEENRALAAEIARAREVSRERGAAVAERIADVEERIGVLATKVARGEDTDGAIAREVADLRAALAGYEGELTRARADASARAQEVERRSAELEARIDRLAADVAAGRDANGAAATQLDELRAALAANEAELGALRAEAGAAAAEGASAPETAALPARFALDAFPDVLALLDTAKDGAQRLSTLIVPGD